MKSALIIFVRNPVLGKVKTRLAADVGNEKALKVYGQLLQHTRTITQNLELTKFVYYADHINKNDLWNEGYSKKQQEGNELGERMQAAFRDLFKEGYSKVCIIGSDCYELNAAIINDAFEQLKKKDMVIGPVPDGGYYLLGLNKMVPQLFANKNWSTETVYFDSIKDALALQLSVYELTVLNDIDNGEDLLNSSLAFFE